MDMFDGLDFQLDLITITGPVLLDLLMCYGTGP